MEVLEVFDLTKSYRATAELCGVDHHSVARVVAARAKGVSSKHEPVAPSSKVASAYIDKIVEWVERSGGRIRADVVHEKLVAMGYQGSERTTRRVVAGIKHQYLHDRHRVYKPWVTEPGAWLQYDFGDGPVVLGTKTVLFCAWLAWSRFRVILALQDRSLASVISALHRTFRLIGGAPTYLLTDNEKTVTDRHIAGVPVRNRSMVDVSRYYGVTICTCVPYDPESKAWATDCTSCWVGEEDVVRDLGVIADAEVERTLPRAVVPRMHRSDSSLRNTCGAVLARPAR